MTNIPQWGQPIARIELGDIEADLTTIQTDVATLVAALLAMREGMNFPSGYEDLITITAASQDIALPSVVVAGIPAGVTITRVVALLKYRVLEDTSGAINKISTAGPVTPAVQVKETVGGAFTDAITLIDDMMRVRASSEGPGDVLLGTIDVSGEVTGDGTYDFQFDDILADGANLLLRDLQVILHIEWTP